MYLGIDCGTQGTKALLIDEDGTTLGRGYTAHAIVERASGAREQEPQWWVEALRSSVAEALSMVQHPKVLALAVSGQQHGLVVLDENNKVIRPAKLWNDTETASQNAELIERFGGKQAYFERFGVVPLTGYTVSKLLWLKQREPENFARIRHILLPHEYLNFHLTGNFHAEYGDASGTAFFDVRSRTWIREILDFIDDGEGHLFAALPTLLRTDEITGKILPEIATDLQLLPDCVVASGGGDNMMGAIGTGNIREGVVTLSLGTSSTVYSYRTKPISDPSGDVAPFCSSSGGWLPLVCTMNATNVVNGTLEALGKTIADIDPALDDTEPGAEGLITMPFHNGERTPDMPRARGSILGFTANNFTSSNMIRSVIEGVTFGILNGLDRILGEDKPRKILVIGGGARSSAWRQMLADVTGATIQVPVEEEAGCLGAAIQAIYQYHHQGGRTVTFEELADRLVKTDETKTVNAHPSRFESYLNARLAYTYAVDQVYNHDDLSPVFAKQASAPDSEKSKPS